MSPNVFADDDGDNSTQNQGVDDTFEIDEEYGRRLTYNRKREDLQRLEELKKKGLIDDDEEGSDEESESDGEDPTVDRKFLDVLLKIKKKDPSIRDKDVKFYSSDESEADEDGVKEKKKKKMYLKDVQAKQLLEEGPDFVEEDEERVNTYAKRQEAMRQAVRDAFEGGGNEGDEDDEDLLKETEKEGDDGLEEDEELIKKMDEYFGEEAELDEGKKFLRDYFGKQMWKDKDGKVNEEELEELEEDENALEMQEEYETNYRHEENAGEMVMGQSRKVEGSVRKMDNSRKAQRKSKEERMKIAEMERQEELKRLKNVKKKEIKEKMKKVLSVAGFKKGEECPLDAKDLDGEFDPDEYDKMMKAVYDDKYYGAEDSDLNSDDDDDGEKPDFDREDELLGLPKDWDVIQGGDGFMATREKVLKQKENGAGDEEKEEEEEEEEKEEGKRKRKQKTSLVQRAKEALMEDYYKLDYEDTIGDLKTRFRYAKVQPNNFQLDTEEILVLDDTELNQYVPLKKMAPYVEKDWEVNRHKVKEQKLKNMELLQRIGKGDEKRSKKKRKKSYDDETKPKQKAADEEAEAETSDKLSRKAKRRRRQAEKKLSSNRMAAYGKTA